MNNNKKMVALMLLLATSTMPFTEKTTFADTASTEVVVTQERNNISLNKLNKVLNDIEMEKQKQREIEEAKKPKILEREKTSVEQIIHDVSKKYNFSELILQAIINAESGFDPNAVGPDTKYGNAHGLMQLIPSTADYIGVNNLYDPYDNVDGGTRLLLQLCDMFGDQEYRDNEGNIVPIEELAFVGYNWGSTNLQNHLDTYGFLNKNAIPKETYYYLIKIDEFRNNGLLTYQYMEGK